MNYVVCLKHGNKYSSDYVNVLHSMVTRNLSVQHEFVCFTENPEGINKDINIQPLPKQAQVQGWWYKPYMFDPNILPSGTRLFLDLDLIIFRNIDSLFTHEADKFCIIRDFNRFQNPQWKKMNSSVFRLNQDQQAHVYEEFVKNPSTNSRRYHGDQDWIYATVRKDWAFWPDEWIRSYKWEMRGRPRMVKVGRERNFETPGVPKITAENKIAVFHGEPNPHNCVDQWCKDNWK